MIKFPFGRRGAVLRHAAGQLAGLAGDRRGNIAPLFALLLVPLVGILSVAFETSSWFLVRQAMQSTADSAVLAAAANGDATNTGSTTYQAEAKAVAANSGFTDGLNHTTVTPLYLTSGCPASLTTCYQVTIRRDVSLYLVGSLGYKGTSGDGGLQEIQATAYASPKSNQTTYCVLSLSTSTAKNGDGYHNDGGNQMNFNGCDVRSNGSLTCNGANSSGNAGLFVFVGTNYGNCSPANQVGSPLPDPYVSLASNIPANTCSSYSGRNLNGTLVLSAQPQIICGNATLTANVSVSAPSSGGVLVIEKGTLNLNGKTLQTQAASGLTIIFAGKVTGISVSQYPTGGGTLDVAAPTSGTWSGVAIYQDPTTITGSQAISYSGGTPSWEITGLVYLPTADLSFSGAVNKSTNGLSCLSIVDNTFMASGTGNIFQNSQSQCAQAGLTPPNDGSAVRQMLVE